MLLVTFFKQKDAIVIPKRSNTLPRNKLHNLKRNAFN